MRQIISFVFVVLFSLLWVNLVVAQAPTKNHYDTKNIFYVNLRPYLNSSEIPIHTQQKLKKIFKITQQFPEIRIHIEVHDSGFDFENQQKLNKSESRNRSETLAKNVQTFLLNLGVSSDAITTEGKGADTPFVFKRVAPKESFILNDSKYSSLKNNRIILHLIPKYIDDTINLELELEAEKIPYWF
jgi:hypothetical protein